MKWNYKPLMKKWTIQIDYTTRDDNGRPLRGRSCFQCEAMDIPSAYALAEAADWGGYQPVKLGAILPGWHIMT